jgi:hypothetical protein
MLRWRQGGEIVLDTCVKNILFTGFSVLKEIKISANLKDYKSGIKALLSTEVAPSTKGVVSSTKIGEISDISLLSFDNGLFGAVA